MSERSEAAPGDVVDLLLRQHAEVRRLFDRVEAAAGHERAEAFHAGGAGQGSKR
ncbi:hypothetical protein [Actinomadura coerulea]|uniref:hypothetical protein n=1 Tax=Actinomadura coerulea TaxID=46159 RepID=UPI003441ADEF